MIYSGPQAVKWSSSPVADGMNRYAKAGNIKQHMTVDKDVDPGTIRGKELL